MNGWGISSRRVTSTVCPLPGCADAPPPRYGSPTALRPTAASVPWPCGRRPRGDGGRGQRRSPASRSPTDSRGVHPPRGQLVGLLLLRRVGGGGVGIGESVGGGVGASSAAAEDSGQRPVGDQSFAEGEMSAAGRERDVKEDESDSGVNNTNLPKYPFTFN